MPRKWRGSLSSKLAERYFRPFPGICLRRISARLTRNQGFSWLFGVTRARAPCLFPRQQCNACKLCCHTKIVKSTCASDLLARDQVRQSTNATAIIPQGSYCIGVVTYAPSSRVHPGRIVSIREVIFHVLRCFWMCRVGFAQTELERRHRRVTMRPLLEDEARKTKDAISDGLEVPLSHKFGCELA